jgi:hypothetical protein
MSTPEHIVVQCGEDLHLYFTSNHVDADPVTHDLAVVLLLAAPLNRLQSVNRVHWISLAETSRLCDQSSLHAGPNQQ